jgi:hypothetical protein
MAARLPKTVLPRGMNRVVTSCMLSPVRSRGDFLNERRSSFRLDPAVPTDAHPRPDDRSEGVERLNLLGASPHQGAGVVAFLSPALVFDAMVSHARP